MDVYEALYTTRAMRRCRPDKIPMDVQQRILDAAVRAPTGGNTQNWRFMLVDDADVMAKLGPIYRSCLGMLWQTIYKERLEIANADPDAPDNDQMLRVQRSAQHLADHFEEYPLLLFSFVQFDPTGGSIFPATWSAMLAARRRHRLVAHVGVHVRDRQGARDPRGADRRGLALLELRDDGLSDRVWGVAPVAPCTRSRSATTGAPTSGSRSTSPSGPRPDAGGSRVRVGVLLLPTDPWPETVARVQRLEAIGYDHLWTYDHLTWRRYRERPWHAAIPWLTGVACATSRVEIGTLVASPNIRHPVTLAQEAITLDHISGGRFVLGVGTGGIGFDSTVFGGEPLDPKELSARLEEFVAVIDGLFREPAVSYEGRYYNVHDASARAVSIRAGGAACDRPAVARTSVWWRGGSATPGSNTGDTTRQDLTPAGTVKMHSPAVGSPRTGLRRDRPGSVGDPPHLPDRQHRGAPAR